MRNVGNYLITEKLNETRNSIIYRAKKEGDASSVIIKELKTSHPSSTEIARFNQEYDIIKGLKLDGVINALDLLAIDSKFYLVLEDFIGISLKLLIETETLSLASFLRIGIQIADTLGRLHASHVIHKDIKPANILINSETGQVKITDFGISKVLTREDDEIYDRKVIEGTLLYMSPEQTGRMNRSVDFRTDLYSLGISFYEMLTGRHPVKSADPIEIMHSHIAINATPPVDLNPDIPEMVSRIVMKLLLKTPEERYQSGFGLKNDLEECLRQLDESGSIKPFKIGARDIPNRFIIPQRLVGRETEIDTLLSEFENACKGDSRILIVKGAPGIGKSALINEIYKPIVAKKGYYISGKYDQFTKDRPYSAIIQAFQGLIKTILTESDERIHQWKENILKAVGRNGKIIIDIFPGLELITGPQPEVETLLPKESRNRFNLTFDNFINVFLKADHPVALFLDDLQWADLASLEFLKRMATSKEIRHLYILCSYRDNEVGEGHPAAHTLKDIEDAGVDIRKISLGPLREEDVKSFILNFIPCTDDVAATLAGLIQSKTGGNPFFINQFLQNLYNEKHITIDPAVGWKVDLENIRTTKVTDNIVDLMSEKISALPKDTLDILKVCAAIGNRFDLNVLAYLMDMPVEKALKDLTIAIEEGYVNYNVELDCYIFHHDRIQEAAYSLIPENERPGLHYRIGRLILKNTPGNEFQDKLFYIVDHLNLGADIVAEKNETIDVARLNLDAGSKARLSAAYSPAMKYIEMGIVLLGEHAWEKEYELTFSLYILAVEVSCLLGEFEKTERFSDTALGKSKTQLDKITVYKHTITASVVLENLDVALNAGMQANLLIGRPIQAGKLNILFQYLKARRNFSGKTDRYILSLPDMTDPIRLATIEFGNALGYTMFILSPEQFVYSVIRVVNESLTYGISPFHANIYAAYGSILIVVFGEIDRGYWFGQLALKMAEKRGARKNRCYAVFNYNCLVRHWKEYIGNTIEGFMDGYRDGLETGDLFYASLSLSLCSYYSFVSGKELMGLLKNVEEYNRTITYLNQTQVLNQQNVLWQVLLNLTGQSDDPLKFKGKAMDEDAIIPVWEATNNKGPLLLYYLYKNIVSMLHHDYTNAIKYLEGVEKYIESGAGSSAIRDLAFFGSLTKLALYPDKPSGERKKYLQWVDKYLKLMKKYSDHCKENSIHRFHLLQAEKARVLGDHDAAQRHYDLAITYAGEYRFQHEEALANELAARFYLSMGKTKLAAVYLKDAFLGYSRWGAVTKVNQLLHLNPDILESALKPFGRHYDSLQGALTDSTTVSSALVDMSTVMKVHEAIAGELNMDIVFERIMKATFENAGAQRGVLILVNESDKALTVAAEGEVDHGIRILKGVPIGHHGGLSVPMVNYVARTREMLLLNNAKAKGDFTNDPYVIENQSKSILCLPIIQQSKLVGILYLENNIATGAFTPNRINVLTLLSSQAAISIENAKLYDNISHARKHLSNLLETANEGFWMVDQKGFTLDVNREMCVILGRPRSDIMGHSIFEFVDEENKKLILNHNRILKSEKKCTYETTLKRSDGVALICQIKATLIEGDEKASSFAMITDITERKRAEAEIQTLNVELEQRVIERTHELNETLAKVEEANKHILESIRYARLIQQSILPNIALMKPWLPDSFFIWEPRDIVGGDFFYAEAVDDGYIIAVVDCTGHGVPGAFMTLVAATSLRRIINLENCHSPGDVLKRLNTIVKTSLHQDTEHALSDDGLDAAICFINPGEKTLIYAGARLPLIMTRNGELTVIKGDRQSVGYADSNLDYTYTEHRFDLHDGLHVYLATDGMVDQLGGEKRLRFSQKLFWELIAQNSGKPFDEQRDILLHALHTHQGGEYRQDDVTVIGFKPPLK